MLKMLSSVLHGIHGVMLMRLCMMMRAEGREWVRSRGLLLAPVRFAFAVLVSLLPLRHRVGSLALQLPHLRMVQNKPLEERKSLTRQMHLGERKKKIERENMNNKIIRLRAPSSSMPFVQKAKDAHPPLPPPCQS